MFNPITGLIQLFTIILDVIIVIPVHGSSWFSLGLQPLSIIFSDLVAGFTLYHDRI